MPTRLLSLFFLLLCLPLAASASGPLDAPTLREGQYVYAVPEGYQPPGVGAAGMAELNEQLADLREPFYAVFVRDLPQLSATESAWARGNGFRGDRDTLRVEVATAMLAEHWAATSRDRFDPGESTLFLLSFSPRKYAWVPGSRWQSEAGVTRGAEQDRFTALFLRAVKRRPADPVAGISALASHLDEHIFRMTDPAQVASRAAREAREAENRRARAARTDLQRALDELDELLPEAEAMGRDVRTYSALRQRTVDALATDDTDTMLEAAQAMESSVSVLRDAVLAHRAEVSAAWWRQTAQRGGILGAIAAFLSSLWFRRRRVAATRSDYASDRDALHKALDNAHGRWAAHYLDREDIVGLDGATGQTAELWARTTKAVDEIYLRIRAMQRHVADCDREAARGSFFSLTPLHAAHRALDQPFAFDTGEVSNADLFAAESSTITVVPDAFMQDTQALFRTSLDDWGRLKRAAHARFTAPVHALPHEGLDALLELAAAEGIPDGWLADHALFGDDASDRNVWQTLDGLRRTDPVAYMDQVHHHLAAETRLEEVLRAIVAARAQVAGTRHEGPLPTFDTVLAPDDDPAITAVRAGQAETALQHAIARVDALDTVLGCAATAAALHRRTTEQVQAVEHALDHAGPAIDAADALARATSNQLQRTNDHARTAADVHMNIAPALNHIAAADRYLRQGQARSTSAKAMLDHRRHVEAARTADEATAAFRQALALVDAARAHLDQLEERRSAFLALRNAMPPTRAALAKEMGGHGTHAQALDPFVDPTPSGRADYAALIVQLEAQRLQWRAATRRSKAAHAKAQAAAATSYGSSGFGGSGGSFGGGGFSGSSGSW